MGLFDSVYIDRPDLGINPMTEFQTKDFDGPFLRKVEITRAGRLILHEIVSSEEVPLAERPYPNATDGTESCGSIRFITEPKDQDFHGILDMINCDTSNNARAKFTDGVLVAFAEGDEEWRLVDREQEL